jgi:5-methylcytosine-specific restriction protein A
MPTQPPRPCARPGCTILTTTGYCDAHAKARRAERNNWRGTPASRGYDKAWTATRLRYISRHPLCEDCAGRGITRAATLVHHLRPISEAPEQRLDENNLRALCFDCHEGRHGRKRPAWNVETQQQTKPSGASCESKPDSGRVPPAPR